MDFLELSPAEQKRARAALKRHSLAWSSDDELDAHVDHLRRLRLDRPDCAAWIEGELALLHQERLNRLRAADVYGRARREDFGGPSKLLARIQAIKGRDQVDLLWVLFGLSFTQSGERYKASCPLHQDRTPSFVLYPDGHWRCFSCNRGGDAVDLMMLTHHVTLGEAVTLVEELTRPAA